MKLVLTQSENIETFVNIYCHLQLEAKWMEVRHGTLIIAQNIAISWKSVKQKIFATFSNHSKITFQFIMKQFHLFNYFSYPISFYFKRLSSSQDKFMISFPEWTHLDKDIRWKRSNYQLLFFQNQLHYLFLTNNAPLSWSLWYYPLFFNRTLWYYRFIYLFF